MCISGKQSIEFKQVNADKVHFSANVCAVRNVAAHQHLFFEGDERTHVFVVEAGWVKLYRTLIDGQRQVVGFCNGGSLLGLEAVSGQVNSCEAITPVRVKAIPIQQLSDICRRDPDLAAQLLQQMGRQLGSAQAHLTTVGAQTADQKLATFLLAFANYEGDASGEFDLPMRRAEIGEFLGLRLETVSRKLSEFQRRGWVSMISLYRCRILNRSAIECLSEGGGTDELQRRIHH